MLDNARKAVVGSVEAFNVLIPEPWTGTPVLTFRRAGVEVAGAGFAVLRATDSITAISGTTLTGTIASAPGFAGPVWGIATLRTAADGDYPVQVERVSPVEVVLSEPLPRTVTCTALRPATLIWRWWSAPIPAAVTATETGDSPVDWWVSYTASHGASVGTQATQRIQGTLTVAAERFSTGMGEEVLSLHYGHIIPRAGMHDRGHSGPIEAARQQMLAYLRKRLVETQSKRREDDINGSDFQAAHATWAASIIMMRQSVEASRELREQALAQVDDALASVTWYDPDGDGEGQNGTPASRASLLAGGSFTARTDTPLNPWYYKQGTARGT